MNLLLSWSKPQSHKIASTLYDWLPTVLPDIVPWISSKDISKGKEWFKELQTVLQRARICIICLTQENLRSPWLFYETGAISQNGDDVFICPYLFEITLHDLADGPLSHFQCTVANKDDTFGLIKSLNEAMAQKQHSEIIKTHFEMHWPSLAEQLAEIRQMDTVVGDDFISTDSEQLAGIKLSSEARTIIVEISKADNGMLLCQPIAGGIHFQIHGENVCPDQSPRTMAKWKAALNDLLAAKILEQERSQWGIYRLTRLGYDIADKLLEENH